MRKFTFVLFAALSTSLFLQAQTITTVAGCGVGDDSIATRAELVLPLDITFDNAGNAYIADGHNFRIRKITTTGVISTIAGTGVQGYSGDGGPATLAQLNNPSSVAVDKHGNIFIADEDNHRIRKINTAGVIYTIAGTGVYGYNGDNIPATLARLNYPHDVILDTAGNVYVADPNNYRVRKIDASGIITTVAGNGYAATSGSTIGNHGPATSAFLSTPIRIAIDDKSNLFIGAYFPYPFIGKVDTGGILTIIADTTGTLAYGADGDGGAAVAATMTSAYGLAFDTAGNLYFSDRFNYRVRMINHATGIVSNFAGIGTGGFAGDGGLASSAEMGILEDIAFDKSGNFYISDQENNRIRMVNNTGIISTYAGQSGVFDNNYAARNAEMCVPVNLTTDVYGNVYVADNYNNRILELNISTGAMTTVAGSGIAGDGYSFSGDGGPATDASIWGPYAVATDPLGNLYISDANSNRVRMVNTAGDISTIAGSNTAGYAGDGGPASSAEIYFPNGVAADAFGNVYIADEKNSRIRRIDAAGIITTIAGTSSSGYTGDGGPATDAELNYPNDVAVDGMGNVYIADWQNNNIRMVDTAGIIHSLLAISTGGFSGDGGPATNAQINGPAGVKADSAGDVFIADYNNQRVRMINTTGIISTIAGDGTAGFSGDGGAATAASLSYPEGVAIDKAGNLYIADGNNYRIRKVSLSYLSVSQTKPQPVDVSVYPNPTHDRITVSIALPFTGTEELTISNIIGQQVHHSMMLTNRQTVDMSSLPDGIYLLQVTNSSGEKKVVKVTKE